MENEQQRLESLYMANLNEDKVDKQVELVVGFILEKEGCTDSSKTLDTKSIQDKYKKLKDDNPELVQLNPSSISTYLSFLSHDSNSSINCQGRKQGYYISLESSLTTEAEETAGCSDDKNALGDTSLHKQLEKSLYPIMLSWLASKVDRVKNVSSHRGSTKWRNPDILGVNFKNLLGIEHVELVSIEVKPCMSNWQQYIFEAVSHYMFVHRAYYAFLHPVEEKIPDIMKIYANQFGIGLISIELDKEDWDKFQNNGKLPEAENIAIVEVAPSVYHEPNIDLESEYLQGLQIHDMTELHKFGNDERQLLQKNEEQIPRAITKKREAAD